MATKKHGTSITKYLAVAGAALAGAASMYILDPLMGNRRRKLMRDQAVHMVHETDDIVIGKSKHLANKAKGMMHKAKSYVKEEVDQVKSGAWKEHA